MDDENHLPCYAELVTTIVLLSLETFCQIVWLHLCVCVFIKEISIQIVKKMCFM